jgi:hypothetical protein
MVRGSTRGTRPLQFSLLHVSEAVCGHSFRLGVLFHYFEFHRFHLFVLQYLHGILCRGLKNESPFSEML